MPIAEVELTYFETLGSLLFASESLRKKMLTATPPISAQIPRCNGRVSHRSSWLGGGSAKRSRDGGGALGGTSQQPKYPNATVRKTLLKIPMIAPDATKRLNAFPMTTPTRLATTVDVMVHGSRIAADCTKMIAANAIDKKNRPSSNRKHIAGTPRTQRHSPR
jgi:hypothetical protein